MATTTGSLDLKSLQELHDDLTQYFWFESNSSATYGAGVHVTLSPKPSFMSDPTGQNILMNTDGISIRNGVLPMMVLDNDSLDFNIVDTTQGIYANVATFGGITRIGRGETGYSRILIDPSSDNDDLINTFEVLTPDDISAFSQKVDKNRTVDNKKFLYYLDNVYTLGSQYKSYDSSATTTTTETFIINDLDSVVNGTTINIVLSSRLSMDAPNQYVYTYLKFDVNFNIVKGTSSTSNVTNVRGAGVVWSGYTSSGINHTVSISYNGNNQITITSAISNVSTSGYFNYLLTNTYISQISYVESIVSMPVVFQSGDIVLSNKGVGRAFLETNSNDDLLNSIITLGWNDVICGVSISPSSTCISNRHSSYSPTVTLTATTVPPNLEVTWTSLDDSLSVTSEGVVSYNGSYIGMEGTNEIQASVSFAGRTYTSTCYVNTFFPS